VVSIDKSSVDGVYDHGWISGWYIGAWGMIRGWQMKCI